MPRPRNPDAPSATERVRRSKASRGVRAVALPAQTIAKLDAIRGEETRVAAVTRLIEQEEERCQQHPEGCNGLSAVP